jgi:AraC-like DNA-binding protein
MMPLAYSELAPSAPLAPYVKCFWILRGQSADAPPVERILPDGAFELIFHFGDPFLANGEPQPEAMLVGQIRRPTIVTPSRRADVVGVRFHIGATAAFFREPVVELRDQFLPMRGCDEIFDARDRVAAIERFLLRRLQPPERWTIAREVAALIARREGALRNRDLTQITGRAERTIERAFNECVGITPKTFSRLMRFRAWLADPLQDHGYFDDAHLIHEFREFAGVSPTQFRRETNALNEVFL